MAHVAEHKKRTVKEFTKLIDEYPIVGVVNMMNLPTKQLQVMREKLRKTVVLKMTKGRLIKIAVDNSKKEGIEKLRPYIKGMPALLLTKENPFSLFSTLKKNKSKAPISAGQTAPNDIVVPAGKTNFSPGPVIGELGSYKIKTAIEDGKIAIKEDKVVAKEGEEVNAKLAGLLQRLGVEPMEIGLDLIVVLENGEILTKEILDIDEEAYKKDFENAAAMAFNLAFNAAYPTTDNIMLLIQKAACDSKSLAIECDLITDETANMLIGKAEMQANSLKSKLNIIDETIETPEETKDEQESTKGVSEEKGETTNDSQKEES